MDSKKYVFDFTVPQGPTGPTGSTGLMGPTGPTGPIGTSVGLRAYGERFSTTSEVLNLGVSSPVQVPLLNFSVLRNVDYSSLSSVIIKEYGVYEINYVLNASVSDTASVTVSVRENGVEIPVTKNTKVVSPAESETFCGNMLYTFNENSVIDLAISSSVATTVTLNNSNSLTIKQIHL